MKQCFFCATPIHEYAKTCGHCWNSQPTQKEIDREYRSIAISYTLGIMLVNPPLLLNIILWLVLITLFFMAALAINALFTNLWDELSPSSVRDFIQRVNNVGSVFWGLLILFAPVSVILWIKTNIFGKYLAKTVFVDAVKIDHDLHENLKNRKHKTSIWPLVALGVLIILAISNPSTQEFQAYYAQKEKAAIELKNLNRTNLVIFSHYQIKDMGKTYWGVLGNFFP